MQKLLQKVAGSTAARDLLYPLADKVLHSYGAVRFRRYDVNNTIALVSTGRGGSTWLAELVMKLPNRVLLWEPLHLGNNPYVARFGLGWNPYVPRAEEAPELEAYLNRLMTGRALSTSTLTSLNLNLRSLANAEGFVVKFVQGHGLMPWFTRRFDVPVIGLVRHPCAVVSSQLKHGNSWRSLTKSKLDVSDRMWEDYPHWLGVYERIETTEEALAFAWAIKTYLLLESDCRLVVSYEEMVESPASTAREIFSRLGVGLPAGALDQMAAPSATTHADAVYTDPSKRLGSWTRNLSMGDQDRILSVCHDVGVKLYTTDLMPDSEGMGGRRKPYSADL